MSSFAHILGGIGMDESSPKHSEKQSEPAPLSQQGVHLIRTAQVNTLALSQMADGKANILIGATFVVFSLVVTKVLGDEIQWSVICLAVTASVASGLLTLDGCGGP